MKRLRFILAGLLILALVFLGCGYIYGKWYFTSHFLMGSEINGFDVSYFTVAQAEDLLDRKVKTYALAVNTRNGGVEKISAMDVGMTYDPKGEVQKLLDGQDTSLWFIPQKDVYQLAETTYTLDRQKLKDAISGLTCMQSMTPPVNAHIVENDGYYYVVPETVGTKLYGEKVYAAIETAIMAGDLTVDLEPYYMNPEITAANSNLQEKCDTLNGLKNIIITYDFGDKVEVVDFDTVRTWLTDYELDKDKIHTYVEELADEYDTVDKERLFRTYDGREKIIPGNGDYGWRMDTDAETEKLYQLILSGETQVHEPVYAQEAQAREENDLGYTYLELDLGKLQIIQYVDGIPVIQDGIEAVAGIQEGCYRLTRGAGGELYFGGQEIYQSPENEEENMFSDILYGTEVLRGNRVTVGTEVYQVLQSEAKEGMPVVVYR